MLVPAINIINLTIVLSIFDCQNDQINKRAKKDGSPII